MRKNLYHLAGHLAHRDLGDMENLSYFHFVGKWDEQKSI